MISAIMKRVLVVFILAILQLQSFGQNDVFDYPEFEITINPIMPGVCPQIEVEVTCIEDCITYTWEMLDPVPDFQILYGKTVTLAYPGTYKLSVEKDIDNIICDKEILFEVVDLSNNSEYESYFSGNGFYSIPILIEEGSKPGKGELRTNQCSDLKNFKFGSEHEFINLGTSTLLNDVFSNFRSVKFISTDEKAQIVTQKECLCSEGIQSFEDALDEASAGLWAHIYQYPNNPGQGKLYLKGKIPGRDQIPEDDDEKQSLIGVVDLVMQYNNSTYEQTRTLLSNTIMYAQLYTEEFEAPNSGSNCGLTDSEIEENYIFTPAGVPIKFPSAATNPTFGNNLKSGAFPGALASFIYDQKTWRAHYQPKNTGKGTIFKGYYTRSKARFSDEVISGECPFCFQFDTHATGVNVPYVLPVFHNFDSECEMTRATGTMDCDANINYHSKSGGYDLPVIYNIKSTAVDIGLGYFDIGPFEETIDICATPTDASDLFNSDNFDYISSLGSDGCGYQGRYVIMRGKGPTYGGRYFAIMAGFDDGSISNTYELVNNCWILSPNIPDLTYEYADVVLFGIHSALDCIGVIPLLGVPADIINATIYIVEGDNTNAAISIAGAVLEGAVIGRYLDEFGEFAYDITGSKRFLHNGAPGEILQNGKYLVFKAIDGEIKLFPIQKIGKILSDLETDDFPYDYLSSKLIDDINSLPLEAQKAFFTALANKPVMVEAWEKLLHDAIPQAIRTNPTYLSAVSKQLAYYGDDIVFQFDRVLPHVDPAKLDDLFAALDNPKSIDHVRSIAGDFENIPGINMSTYIANGLPKVAIPAPSTWADPLLGLPDWTATTFTNVIGKTLSPNQKLYRVLGPDQSSMGGFWTYELPTLKSQLYGGTAVRPEWNAATHYVEYTVPQGGLKVWDGPTASQKILDGIDEVNLPGGATQIYIPDPYRQVGSGFENLPKISINLQ